MEKTFKNAMKEKRQLIEHLNQIIFELMQKKEGSEVGANE